VIVLAVSLVAVGSLAHAFWNALVKKANGSGPEFLLSYLIVSIISCIPFVAIFGSEWSLANVGRTWWLAGMSAVFHTAYALVLQRSYRSSAMSVVYPTSRALGPLLAVLAAWVLWDEILTSIGYVGFGLVLFGIVGLSYGQRESSSAGWSGFALGACVGLAIAAYTVWDDYSVSRHGVDPVLYYVLTVSFQFLLVAGFKPSAIREVPLIVRSSWRYVICIGILVPFSYVSVLYAMSLAPLSIVAPVRTLNVVFGMLLATLFLREGSLRAVIPGGLLIFLGLILVATP
jgi:drug/metabolite transporter (DMT)-like permease